MKFKSVFYVNGLLLLILSACMSLPMLVDLAHNSRDWQVFAVSQVVTAFIGFALIFTNHERKFHMTLRETFLLTTFSWFFLTTFAALPFAFSGLDLSYTDAFFEAMSGLTTTGATAITGLDDLPKGILLWRMLLHWLGGIGFLIIALAFLPLLQISGMQIFKTQSFGTEKVLPSAKQIASYIIIIYFGLTLMCSILYHAAGMNVFDSVSHAMSAIATGGFANYDSSIGYFNSRTIDIITIVFMLAGAIPFVLYVRIAKGDVLCLHRDSQVRAMFRIILALTSLAFVYLLYTGQSGFFGGLIDALFMVVTLMSTTGYANKDYTVWGPLIIGIAFLASFLGCCSGSTSGGIKTFRLQILWSMFQQQIRKLINPNGIFQVYYNGKIVGPDVQASVAGFFFVYIATWIIVSILLLFTGLDFMTATTGAISAISNVGPGLGPVIGPAGNFASLPDDSKWILSMAMLVGRMEFLTLLVLLAPRFWKD